MNITGTLPEAGNLKLIITRPLPEKTCAAIEGVYTKADRKLSKMDRNTSKVLVKVIKTMAKRLTLKINLFDRINANKKYFIAPHN